MAQTSVVAPQTSPSSKNRLLFMGLKRGGKSSIINVVLYKLPPTETVFIPTTIVIKKHVLPSYRNFQLWDLPGQINFLQANFDTDSIYSSAGAMIWVLDAQDDYLESIQRLTESILQLQQSYPDIKYSVFIHKVDSLSSDFREDTIRDIIQRIMDDLNDAGLENPPISFYPTSVYDDSIYEALSKVLQILSPQLCATFEALLNTITVSCKMQKLYLFDIASKLYVASDTSPVDMAGYSLCSDFIDTIVDLSEIYGWDRGLEGRRTLEEGEMEGHGVGDAEEEGAERPKTSEQTDQGDGAVQKTGTGDDLNTESFISGVRGGCCLYLKEMNRFLALIGFSREPRFAEEKPLIDYNVQVFQDALNQVLTLV